MNSAPKSSNQNIAYELFVKEIYEQILLEDGYKNIEVKHNIKIRGNSKKEQFHQIDIYWEFTIAEVIHRVAIECKNYSKPVSKDKISAFLGVLQDIGNIQGVFISNSGYQSGAKIFADNHGIFLKEARLPKDADWEGLIKTINVNINCIVPSVRVQISPCVDANYLLANNIFSTKNEIDSYISSINPNLFGNMVYSQNREPLCAFDDIIQEFQGGCSINNYNSHSTFFTNGYLLDNSLGLIKIRGVTFDYFVDNSNIIKNSFTIDHSRMVKAILKDVKTGNIKFINQNKPIKYEIK